MRAIIIFLWPAAALAIGLGAIQAQSRGSNQFVPLSLKASVKSARIVVGSPVVLSIEMRNESDKTIDIMSVYAGGPGTISYGWEIRDAKGNLLKPAKRPNDSRGRELVGSAVGAPIPPGKNRTELVYIPDSFDLSKPGRYQVRVLRDMPPALGSKTIASNWVEFEIVSAKPPSR